MKTLYGIVDLKRKVVVETITVEWNNPYVDRPADTALSQLRPCEENERYFLLVGGQAPWEGAGA